MGDRVQDKAQPSRLGSPANVIGPQSCGDFDIGPIAQDRRISSRSDRGDVFGCDLR